MVAISSTSIRLSWLAPREEQQNGVITSYRITLTDTEGGQMSQRTTSANDLVLIIDSLLPYHTYQCTIAAFTVAIGPETSAQVTTFQEGTCNHKNQQYTSTISTLLLQTQRQMGLPEMPLPLCWTQVELIVAGCRRYLRK